MLIQMRWLSGSYANALDELALQTLGHRVGSLVSTMDEEQQEKIVSQFQDFRARMIMPPLSSFLRSNQVIAHYLNCYLKHLCLTNQDRKY